jgi:hypothetical protein
MCDFTIFANFNNPPSNSLQVFRQAWVVCV